MAAFDLMEVTVNCYVKFGVDIIGISLHDVWNIFFCKLVITNMAFEVKSNKYGVYRMCM
jgi:hypothetical protein